ncbi:MAG: hypothetical protein AABP62_13035 [Planctomycetota bacterium]
MTTSMTLNGRVHGRTIEFDEPLPCGEGERVLVTLIPVTVANSTEPLPPGEGLRRAFGILSQEEGEDLDRFIEASRLDSCNDRGSEQT